MNQKQNDELQMLVDLQQFLKIQVNANKIAPIPDLTDGASELDTHIQTINDHKLITDKDYKGIRKNKKQLRATVVNDILTLSGPLANLGRKNNDRELVEKYNFSKSELKDMRDLDLLTAAQYTSADAAAKLVALNTAGVTNQMVLNLDSHRAALLAIVASPAQARQLKKAANGIIRSTFPTTRALIDITLTPLMRTNFAKTDSLFYNTYLASTLITTTGLRHFDFFGLIIDSNGNSVYKASIRLINSDGTEISKTITGPKGHFAFKEIPQGICSVEISRPGIETKIFHGISLVKGIPFKKTFTI